VDQIREIIQFLSLKSQYAGYKLVVISPADKMNINAANSLLKTLEEPPQDTILILITEKPARLPATIRSRCQKISFIKPPLEIALDWLRSRLDTQHDAAVLLELAQGSPLRALKIADENWLEQRMTLLVDLENVACGQSDPVLIANKWLKFGKKESLYWLYSWLVDMVRMKMAYRPPLIGNPDIHQRLRDMADKQEITRLFGRLDRVNRAIQLSDSQVNGQLLLEEILLGWVPRQV
jgi:DNA polymerase-3 subunit delta'